MSRCAPPPDRLDNTLLYHLCQHARDSVRLPVPCAFPFNLRDAVHPPSPLGCQPHPHPLPVTLTLTPLIHGNTVLMQSSCSLVLPCRSGARCVQGGRCARAAALPPPPLCHALCHTRRRCAAHARPPSRAGLERRAGPPRMPVQRLHAALGGVRRRGAEAAGSVGGGGGRGCGGGAPPKKPPASSSLQARRADTPHAEPPPTTTTSRWAITCAAPPSRARVNGRAVAGAGDREAARPPPARAAVCLSA